MMEKPQPSAHSPGNQARKAMHISDAEKEEKRALFLKVIGFLRKNIGENVFRTGKTKNDVFIWAKKVNPVVFDAVCTATVLAGDTIGDKTLLGKYMELLQDKEFDIVSRQRTTNTDNIRRRISIAARILYGLNL